MARPKGSGVLKTIAPQKHDSFTTRRRLHTGGEPVKDDAAKLPKLLAQWRKLNDEVRSILEGDEAEVTGRGADARTRKRVKHLMAQIDDTWQQLRQHAQQAPRYGEITGTSDLLIHWRNLIAQRDDCARRLQNGEGDKWTRKRREQLNTEIDKTWRRLGEALIENSGAGNWNSADLSKNLNCSRKQRGHLLSLGRKRWFGFSPCSQWGSSRNGSVLSWPSRTHASPWTCLRVNFLRWCARMDLKSEWSGWSGG